jgi:hypothetical protein
MTLCHEADGLRDGIAARFAFPPVTLERDAQTLPPMRHVENGRLSERRMGLYFTVKTCAAGVGRDFHLLGRDLYGALAINRFLGGNYAREAEEVKADTFPF